ncbi:hypothetical protein Ddc_23245 [Ditylenchus destructor]|nr:hypothetical protein Ddc_23245 [Ditylenchus destructor]
MPTFSSVVFAAASLLVLLAEFSSNCQVLATAFGGIGADGFGGDFGFGDTRYYFLLRPQRSFMAYHQVQHPEPYLASPYIDQGADLSESQPASENPVPYICALLQYSICKHLYYSQ